MHRSSLLVCTMALTGAMSLLAQTSTVQCTAATPNGPYTCSNGATIPATPAPSTSVQQPAMPQSPQTASLPPTTPAEPTTKPAYQVHPFSAVAISAGVSTFGGTLELATPLTRKLNLRGIAGYVGFSSDFTVSSIHVTPNLQLRNAALVVDYFPFGGGFHISGGVGGTNNTSKAYAVIPAGTGFTLNDQDYTSSAADPVHGNIAIDWGGSAAGIASIGWGNLIPRSGRHWSFPVELGAQIRQNAPVVYLSLSGTACQGSATSGPTCAPVQSDPSTQQNLQAEQKTLNDDIKYLRYYPFLSFGVGYRF